MIFQQYEQLCLIVLVLLISKTCGRIKDVTEAPDPDCERPLLQNGLIVGKNHTFFAGETAEVVCEDGYRFLHSLSSMIHLKCQEGGKWIDILGNEDVPTCERIGSCVLPAVTGGLVLSKPGGYMPGEIAPVECHVGEPQTPTIMCHSDGTWQLQADLCSDNVRHCNFPPIIQNGGYRLSTDVQLGYIPDGGKVTFYCDFGYMLENEESICSNGKLQGPEPRCIEKQNSSLCGHPQAVKHAHYSIDGSNVRPGDDQFLEGSKVEYSCEEGYRLHGSQSLTCISSEWAGELPSCLPGCSAPPIIPHGDYNFFGQQNVMESLGRSVEGTKAYYFCDNGYKMKDKNMSILKCKEGIWTGTPPVCKKRTACDPPMDIPNGNWVILSIYPDFRIGSRVQYECDDQYKAIGQSTIGCLESGYWSDYAPKCLPKDGYCSEPEPIEHGFYMCDPNHCNLFKVGTNVHYLCNKGYEVQTDDVTLMTCEKGGVWSEAKPTCTKVIAGASADSIEFTSSTLTIVIVTSSSILGLLLVVIIVVIFQRRQKPRHSHYTQQLPANGGIPEGYEHMQEARIIPSLDEHDRVALIAFADGVQVILPTYEEATRSHGSQSSVNGRLHRYNSDSSRSSGRSREYRDYRPLPTLPHGFRHHGNFLREVGDQRDHHRNSVITTNSSVVTRVGGDNLSNAFGSIDTMNVSDNTSTTVTLGTYDSGASNPSLAHSQRAAAGSLASSNPSLATEDAPLIEQPEATLMLRSQTASPSIPEVEEEMEEGTPAEEDAQK